MMAFFRYDFGYAWPWTSGHLIAAVVFGVLALGVWRAGLPRWIAGLLGVMCLWAVIGTAIIHGALRFSLPLELPTESFLQANTGRVVDLGAGSGRATLMVINPDVWIRVALPMFVEHGYFGQQPIPDVSRERRVADHICRRTT